jgi:exonuclease SbcC
MKGIKGIDAEQRLTGRDIIIGRNGSGKTTRAQALGIALTGHVPGGGKLASETIKLASSGSMTVGLKTDGFSFTRTFKQKGSKTEQSISLMPPGGEATAADKERRIEAELGRLPVMLDFGEFLGLSDMKRREFIFGLADPCGEEWDEKRLKDEIGNRLGGNHGEGAPAAIAECVGQSMDAGGIRERLPLMYGYAKEQAGFWKAERDKAAGAAQKIAEYKNELDETDRDLEKNRAELATLHVRQTEASVELADAENANSRAREINAGIASLKSDIEGLEGAAAPDDPAELRELIAQYSADIKDTDNRAAIADLLRQAETARKAQDSAASECEQCRNEYVVTAARKDAADKLLASLRGRAGTCAIDGRIECRMDFTDFIRQTEEEAGRLRLAMDGLRDKGMDAKAGLEAAKAAVAALETDMQALRDEEADARRENDELRALIAGLQKDLRKAETFETERTTRLSMKRDELKALGEPREQTDTSGLRAALEETRLAIRDLEGKIEGQSKARNSLINLKSSMADGEKAAAAAEMWKDIAGAIGPKGLQGKLVKDALSPLSESAQTKLAQMGVGKTFYFQTEDGGAKEIFRFGWEGQDGGRRDFDALSTGEQMLLLIALMTTVIERINPPLKALIIDNAENLDHDNLRRVLNGLTTAGAGLDNIVFLGVFDIAPEDAGGWKIWDLAAGNGQGAA